MTPPDDRLPADFGKYRLEKRIATGGMAEVFLAHRHGTPHEPLVIKRILPHISQDKSFVQMFTDEARVAANLDHPNVVRILDLGLVDGTYFLAMEYVHGEDIRRIYNRAYKLQWSLPLSHSIRVIADAAQGLAYAHQVQDPLTGDPMGLVHRDVSPQNILVTYAGDAKVVDFGIAQAAHKVQQTRAGQLKGKYSYMSPEQALGDPVDHRTDIFALGVILYETTTGTRLFKRHNELATLQAVMKCDFVAPHEALPNYPPELEALLLKALERRPEDRWSDAAAFSAALYDFLYESGLYVDREQVGGFMRDLFADANEDGSLSAGSLPADPAPEPALQEPAPPDPSSDDGQLRPLAEPTRGPTVAERKRGRSTEEGLPAESPWHDEDFAPTSRGTPPSEEELMEAMVAAGFGDPAEDDEDLAFAEPDGEADAEPEAPPSPSLDPLEETGPEPDLRNRPVTLDHDQRRRDTVLVRERRAPIEPPSVELAEDVAPTVAAVPTYRPPEPQSTPALSPGVPVVTSTPPLVKPVRSVPAYADATGPVPSGGRRPTERTDQIRAQALPPAEDIRAAWHPPPKPRGTSRTWLVVAGLGAVALAAAVAMGATRWLQTPSPQAVADPPIAPLPEAMLTVDTEAGAAIFLDDRKLGIADARGAAGPFRVPAGRQTIRVALAGQGFERERRLALQPNQNYHYEIRGRTGWLRLVVTPWGQVSIDGKSMGVTPLPRVGLLEGVHEIRLENPDLGRFYETTVRIKPGGESNLRVDLESVGEQL